MGSKRFLVIAVAVAIALNCYSPALLAQSRTSTTNPTGEAARAQSAATAFSEIMEAPDQGIPDALLKKAYGIAVIPHVVKAALAIDGSYAKGLVAQRHSDGTWGVPLFIQVSGESLGAQIGVEATDVVIIFTKLDGVQPLAKGSLEIGGDNATAAGPTGRMPGHAGSEITYSAAIYSYSRSSGMFAGMGLNNVVIQIDDDANHSIYGKEAVTTDTSKSKITGPSMAAVQPFILALEKYASAATPQAALKQ